ncbi:MAG: CoB--CoM heterodisulfide reductase iron-sulfur subunit B family protein [Pseudomonadota bacterium]
MDLSYYPGCTLTGSARELDESFRSAAEMLGVRLSELPDWTCCGASSAHVVDAYLEVALPARDLMVAQGLGRDVVAPCAACVLRLKHAAKSLGENDALRKEFPYKGEIKVLSGIEMFHLAELRSLVKERIKKPLKGLKVIPYYGCLAVRPPEVLEPDDIENPMQMDEVLDLLGAEVLRWPYKTDCCGGSLALTRTDLVLKLSGKLLDMARDLQADAIVTMCPMCQANLDTRQADLSAQTGRTYAMPIIYLSELLAVALGDVRSGQWFDKHMVSPKEVLREKGLL